MFHTVNITFKQNVRIYFLKVIENTYSTMSDSTCWPKITFRWFNKAPSLDEADIIAQYFKIQIQMFLKSFEPH